MADRIAEPDDVAVDELKRKARRRLVGAIVLALAAAIVVPMLLEREPRPLGDEVSVQIPPVDDGKFVNRLTGKSDSTASRNDAKPKVDAAPVLPPASSASVTPPHAAATRASDNAVAQKSIADVEQRVLAAPARPPAVTVVPADQKPAARADIKPDPAAGAPGAPSAVAKSDTAKAVPAPAPKTEPARGETVPDAVIATSPASEATGAASKGDTFVVQLAAFADDKGANSLAGKLKRAGYPAFTEPVQTSRGTLWRVRVGSYPTREAAGDARGKLKADGYSGIVAATR